jgi:hypothetical protein
VFGSNSDVTFNHHAADRACKHADPARQYEGYSMEQAIIGLGKTPRPFEMLG